MKKLNIEYIKNEFEKRNYTLLETKYINNSTKMKIVCDEGHEFKISWGSFKSGCGCKICSLNKLSKKYRHDYTYIKNEFDKIGYKLLENEYINNKIKMKFMCNKGHEHIISWGEFKNGNRCGICKYEDIAKKRKHNYEYVFNFFKNESYFLLSNEYKNNRTYLEVKCPENHIYKTTFDKFKNGNRCRKCFNIKMSKLMTGENHPNYNKDRDYIKLRKETSKRCNLLLRRCLFILNIKKTDKTDKILGYSRKELLNHLETFKNWNTIKENNWHLDHKIPIKAFIDNGITNLKIINHLSNLQPLLAEENLKKGCNYKQQELIDYLNKFNISIGENINE